jgi:nucleolin
MATTDSRILFVTGLSLSTNEEVVRKLFEATDATVREVKIPKGPSGDSARGFGFVTLDTSEQANHARTVLDGSLHEGRSITVKHFQASSGRHDARAGACKLLCRCQNCGAPGQDSDGSCTYCGAPPKSK